MGNVGEIQEMQRWYSSSASSSKLPLLSLNHVSFVCKSVSKSVRFYEDVLGFMLIKRPSSFKFEGAWLFNHGIGIHLLESESSMASPAEKKGRIDPKDNHISFECSDMRVVMQKLEEMKIEYVTAKVEEGGIIVDQLFFHDPDGYMVEICNCQNLPLIPLSSCPLNLTTSTNTNYASSSSSSSSSPSFYGKQSPEMHCSAEAATLMMESLVMDVMTISM